MRLKFSRKYYIYKPVNLILVFYPTKLYVFAPVWKFTTYFCHFKLVNLFYLGLVFNPNPKNHSLLNLSGTTVFMLVSRALSNFSHVSNSHFHVCLGIFKLQQEHFFVVRKHWSFRFRWYWTWKLSHFWRFWVLWI